MSITTLRPSSMPKVGECAKYENSPFKAGPPAQRGDLGDESYREAFLGNMRPLETLDANVQKLADENNTTLEPLREGIEWAIERTKLIAGDEDIITEEEYLWVEVEEMDSGGGTMDADIPAKAIGIDLKTGQIRNYKEQMATYALGRMRADFLEEYTMILIFCDQKETITHRFTYAEAERIVQRLREKHLDPDEKPTPCQYCNWCGAYERCQARKELATRVAGHMNVQERWEIILEDPVELAEFVRGATELEAFKDSGKKKLLEFAEAGIELEGFHRRNGKITATLPAENLIAWIQDHPEVNWQDVIRQMGAISKAKLKKVADAAGESVEGVNFMEFQGAAYVQKNAERKKKDS